MMDRLKYIFLLFLLINTALSVTAPDAECNLDGDCLNSGQCKLVPGKAKKECQCSPYYAGPQCQYRKCPENACVNNGICEWAEPVFKCHCPLGYSGSYCETKLSTACDTKGCINGNCRLDGSIDKAVCDCFYGFTGDKCQTKTFCHSASCSGHGKCSSDNVSVTCSCDEGWTGDRCETDINECAADSSLCLHGTCVNLPGSYVCQCSVGYTGPRCDQIDPGSCSSQPCQNGATCNPGFNFKTKRAYTCQCLEGFIGTLCEENVNECIPYNDTNLGDFGINVSRCANGGSCIDSINGFKCVCSDGFTGLDCRQNIDECSLFGPSLCQNGGTCIDTHGGFQCACVVGFTGERCEIDVDDCVDNMCYKGSKCIDKTRGYTCECSDDRFGQYCQFENPCSSKNNNCLHGECVHDYFNGNATCLCKKGYTGKFCDVDIDECAASPSPCYRGKCINTPGSYKCECEKGYEGPNCDISIDECESRPCFHGGTCIDLAGDYKCICMPSWHGKQCEIPKPYSPACDSLVCLHGGVCRKTPFGEEYCQCPPLFDGETCEIMKQDPCKANRCQNGSKCVPTNDYNSYVCDCQQGYGGIYCDKRIQSCMENPCLVGQCLPTSNGFQCQCPAGYRGETCEININECRPNLCGTGICVDQVGGYSCSCPATHAGDHCEIEVTDPCQHNPCMHNGTCMTVDVRGNFLCTCQPGYTGSRCEASSQICNSAKCLNGGFCSANENSCSCPENFNGTFCERNQDMCSAISCQNGGTCENLDNDYVCNCPYGFAGRKCEKKVNVETYKPEEKKEQDLCEKNGCAALAGNGICDAQCNFPGCNYDGGDCSAAIPKPFGNCKYEVYCQYVFRDNHCDEICNNEACLFDGFDCQEKAATKCLNEEYCLAQYGNGICNPQCNSAACGWDGGDCTSKREELSDDLVLTLITNPETFVEKIAPKLLMVVSQHLHVSARYQLDENGQPMIYHWSSEGGKGELISLNSKAAETRMKRSIRKEGVMVYLKLDVSVCQQLSSLSNVLEVETMTEGSKQQCFSGVQSAANMLAAESSKQTFDQLDVGLYDARVMPRNQETSSNFVLYIVVTVVISVALVIVVVNTLQTRGVKRKLVSVRSIFVPPTTEELEKRSQLKHYPYNLDHQSLMPSMNSLYEPAQKKAKEEPTKSFTLLHQYACVAEPITDEKLKEPGIKQCATVLDPDDRTCVHWAVESVSEKSCQVVIQDIKKLVSIGCPIDAQDNSGATALHLAIRNNRIEVALYLLNYIDANIEDEDGRTALFDAICVKSLEVVKEILRHDNVDVNALAYVNDTALIKCCRMGDEMLPFVELLLKHPRIQIDKTADKSALEYSGKTAVHEAAACNSVKILQALIQKGGSHASHDVHQQTPLFYAVQSNQVDAVKLLISVMKQHKAEINSHNDCDTTPLDIAITHGFTEIINLLTNAGAQVYHPPPRRAIVPSNEHGFPQLPVSINDLPKYQEFPTLNRNIEKGSCNPKSVKSTKRKATAALDAPHMSPPNPAMMHPSCYMGYPAPQQYMMPSFSQQQQNAYMMNQMMLQNQHQQYQQQPRSNGYSQAPSGDVLPSVSQPQSNYSSSSPSAQPSNYTLVHSESPHVSDSAYDSPSSTAYHNSSSSTNTSGHSDTSSFASPSGSHDHSFWPNTSPDTVTGSCSTLVAPVQQPYGQEPSKLEFTQHPTNNRMYPASSVSQMQPPVSHPSWNDYQGIQDHHFYGSTDNLGYYHHALQHQQHMGYPYYPNHHRPSQIPYPQGSLHMQRSMSIANIPQ